mmetsp:Transcript_22638/g.31947  ORF Transcript_22638/g.31947 Transcript_22638/m.31947 type:complete len:125 (-) Transcript_22638:2614-2988(-)
MGTVHCDNAFANMQNDLSFEGVFFNVCSANEHVPHIERSHRHIKDHIQCIYNVLPFTIIPNLMIICLVYTVVFWINALPPASSPDAISMRQIVLGKHINYAKHCRLEFGSYVQVHDPHDNSLCS